MHMSVNMTPIIDGWGQDPNQNNGCQAHLQEASSGFCGGPEGVWDLELGLKDGRGVGV